ncbi:MAG: pyridoxamine 5'-phosphate oxidase [Candidatus Omnitrophica bacterium]|nr:pyridoxamine 5'-phosphate oxidase [Candidatus Omnitrophota bacterium]
MTDPNFDLNRFRETLRETPLLEDEAGHDPFQLFARWYNEMEKAEIFQPTAMTLATVSEEGRPSARVVLLKEYGEEGFVFFTNYESRKGRELAATPHAALLFYWRELGRQIRIEGRVEKTDSETSFQYFASRPRGSQIGAWASAQSDTVESREEMDQRYREVEEKFRNEDPLPLPPFWGGYRLVPSRFEFWQERASRYHDRLVYDRIQENSWSLSRLNP